MFFVRFQFQYKRQEEVISDQWSVINGQCADSQFIMLYDKQGIQSFSRSVHQLLINVLPVK